MTKDPQMSMPSKLITTLTLATLLLLAGCEDKNPAERIQAAKKALQAADYKAAVIALKDALQSAPANMEARLLLAESLQAQGQWADSEKELKKARELGASPEQILPRLARSLVAQGKFQEAIDLKAPAIGLGSQALASLQAERANAQMGLNKPNDAAQAIAEGERALARLGTDDFSRDLHLAKARLAYFNKQPGEALSLLEAALKREPRFIEALMLKAALLEAGHKDAEAFKVYQQLLALDPKLVAAHLAMANQYLKANNLDAAEKAVQAAEKIAANDALVLYARAAVELGRGKMKEANATIMQVLRVLPEHLPSRLLEAMTSYSLGKFEQSHKDAEYVLAQVPGNLVAARILLATKLKLNDADGAIKVLAPILARHGEDGAILALAGEAHIRVRDYAKAMAFLERAAALNPADASLWSQQAAGHLGRGDVPQAIATLEKSVALSKAPGQADMALIMLHMKQKQFDQALKAIDALDKKLQGNPVTLVLRANAHLAKNDPAAARKALEQALALDPKFFPAAASLASLDMQSRNPQAARKRFEGVLAQDKANVPAMLALADLARASNQEKEYVNWLENAIKVDAKNIKPRMLLIGHYLARKENGKALAQAREVSHQNPGSPLALELLGSTQLATGDKNAAIASFKSLIEKAPTYLDAYYHLAMAQQAAKETQNARASLQKLLQLKPEHSQARDALMRLDLENRNFDAALASAREIQARQARAPQGFDREGDIHLAQKRYALAGKAYQQAIDRGAGSSVMIKQHRVLNLAGDNKAASQMLDVWLQRHPEDSATRGYAAEYYMLNGRHKEAIAQFEELQKRSPGNLVVLNNLASLYQREKDKRALATAEQAYKLAPEHPAVQDTLAWILVEQGQLPRALDLLRSAAAKTPNVGQLRYHYGVALARSGKKAEAKKELQAALAGGQKFGEVEEARALLKGL